MYSQFFYSLLGVIIFPKEKTLSSYFRDYKKNRACSLMGVIKGVSVRPLRSKFTPTYKNRPLPILRFVL
jgi:hypothetical protein